MSTNTADAGVRPPPIPPRRMKSLWRKPSKLMNDDQPVASSSTSDLPLPNVKAASSSNLLSAFSSSNVDLPQTSTLVNPSATSSAASTQSARSKLKNFITEPASQAVRALGGGPGKRSSVPQPTRSIPNLREQHDQHKNYAARANTIARSSTTNVSATPSKVPRSSIPVRTSSITTPTAPLPPTVSTPSPSPPRKTDLGRSLLKASRSTPSLPRRAKKGKGKDLLDDDDEDEKPATVGKKKKGGRHSLAMLFHKNRSTSAVSPHSSETPSPSDIDLTSPEDELKPIEKLPPSILSQPKRSTLSPPITPTSSYFLNNSRPSSGSNSAAGSVGLPDLSPATTRGLSRPSSSSLSRPPSQSALRGSNGEPSSLRGSAQTLQNTVYRHNPSASSLSPAGYSLSSSSFQHSRSSLINGSHTSLSLSQTSLILPDGPRHSLLSQEHYHLRFACTYITYLLTPALRHANFSTSERNLEIKRISEDRLGHLARMERSWGSSWAEASGEILSGKQSGVSLEVKEAKLRACNITATAKAHERKVFVSAVRDGILLCFLFNRLFPSQPAHIQRVKVPRDEARIRANIDRFLSACSEIGVSENDSFTMADLDEHSPAGLARVARTILVLARMSGSAVVLPAKKSKRNLRGEGSVNKSSIPKVRSRPHSEQTPAPSNNATPMASRTALERTLKNSSSDLRLRREGVATNGVLPTPAAMNGSTMSLTASTESDHASAASGSNLKSVYAPPSRLSQQFFSPTPPLSPARAASTPNASSRSNAAIQNGTPPTARPPMRTIHNSKVSFANDSSSPRASGHDWSSSISSTQSSYHLAPLQERERTPSLISTNSQVASSYSRSSMMAIPIVPGEDQRAIDATDVEPIDIPLGSSPSVRPELPPNVRRMSEQTLQEARRKIIGTLLTSTDDLHAQHGMTPNGRLSSSLEEARGFALSASLAALEGSGIGGPTTLSLRSDSPRLRPISRAARTQSIELQHDSFIEEDEVGSRSPARAPGELPPRPRIRRSSVTGKIYVPKRAPSPGVGMQSTLSSSSIPIPIDPNLAAEAYGTRRALTKQERRRSEDFPLRPMSISNANRVMNMRNNHSMVNLPSTTRRTSTLSFTSRDSAVYPSLQILEFSMAGQPAMRYQLGNRIGTGQFGAVYRSLNLTNGQMVAIKRIRVAGMQQKEIDDVMREVELLARLSHPGIVKYEGMSCDNEFLNIVLEFVENGSLQHTLKAFGNFNERLVASYVAKILEGLIYLHSQGVVHCDLKAANILSTKNGNIKLSDFGVSLNMRAVETFAERASIGKAESSEVAGTPNWMAPEIIKLAGASPASDIWSLGCTIIELLTGKPPYHNVGNSMTVLFRIVEDPMPPLPPTSPELEDFLKLCFIKEPGDRPSATLLFEHEWVRAARGDIDLSPQDSLPFLRRVSQDQRTDSQRIFANPIDIPKVSDSVRIKEANGIFPTRSASTSLVDLSTTPKENDVQKYAQMSMVSLHSQASQSRECLQSSSARAHGLVKTTFAKAITCHVCLENVKKSAYLCQNCGLITHAKCAARASPRCDVREQLALLAHQQEFAAAVTTPPESRATSPYLADTSPTTSNGLSGFPGRFFGRGNRSKSSLLAPSTTSLVEPDRRARWSTGAGSNHSRSHLDAVPTPASNGHETISSVRSRLSEGSEECVRDPRGASTTLLRIDEDGPSHEKESAGPPPVMRHAPIEGGKPVRKPSMRLRMKREKRDKNGVMDDDDVAPKDCIVM